MGSQSTSKHEKGTKGSAPPEKSEIVREERLQALFTAADPLVKPSEALRQRVAAVTAPHAPHAAKGEDRSRRGTRSWTPLRIGLGLAGAAAVTFAAIGVVPTLVAAKALRRMQAAITDARSMHEVVWNLNPDGSRVKQGETWYQSGCWRIEDTSSGQIQIFAHGKLWTYQPRLNKVSVWRAEGPFGYNPSGFSITARGRDFANWGWRDRIRLLDDRLLGRRRARQVTIDRPWEKMRLLMLVDATTDLPFETQAQQETARGWVTRGISEQHYNEPLPAALFEPDFPKSAPVFDRDHGQQEWGRRLARGMTRQRVGDRTIVIRDVQMNAEGDLFLLYTAGKYPGDSRRTRNYLAGRDWKLDMRDDCGTVYLRQQDNWTTLTHQAPVLPNGYVFNGEKLEGDWWVPLVPQNPWKPRRFTITFHVSPVNIHGDYNDPPVEEKDTGIAVFRLPVSRPGTDLVPDYMPYMAIGYDRWALLSRAARARGFYYRYEQKDLPRALAYYREVNRLREEQAQETGEPIRDGQTWLDLGQVLREMGHKEEARSALERALRELGGDSLAQQQAEEALKALR